jgi:integrase
MAKPNLRVVTPNTVNRAVATPLRPKNAELRSREHLTTDEVERLIEATKGNRHGQRDALMILLSYRHGLRAAEVCGLLWEQVDWKNNRLHVRRVKGGLESTHPLTGREMRELRKLQRDGNGSPGLFNSERGAPMDATAFSTMVKRAAAAAKLGIKAHAHMLRHACGFKLANDGADTRAIQAYMGHANIANTARYTALAANRFKGFFTD